jgi:positive regulator of sigma E activity
MFVELSWFTSPLLVLIAPKMLFEDLRQGTPISLFVGFACYGIALIVAPRLRRREAHAAGDLDPTSKGSNGTDTA